jgi:hypothetical protein
MKLVPKQKTGSQIFYEPVFFIPTIEIKHPTTPLPQIRTAHTPE